MLLARLAFFGGLLGLVRIAWLGRVTGIAGIRLARLGKLCILPVLVPSIRQGGHLYSLFARPRQRKVSRDLIEHSKCEVDYQRTSCENKQVIDSVSELGSR